MFDEMMLKKVLKLLEFKETIKLANEFSLKKSSEIGYFCCIVF